MDFDFKIKLDGKRLIFRDYVNYLGILIDKSLNWSSGKIGHKSETLQIGDRDIERL